MTARRGVELLSTPNPIDLQAAVVQIAQKAVTELTAARNATPASTAAQLGEDVIAKHHSQFDQAAARPRGRRRVSSAQGRRQQRAARATVGTRAIRASCGGYPRALSGECMRRPGNEVSHCPLLIRQAAAANPDTRRT